MHEDKLARDEDSLDHPLPGGVRHDLQQSLGNVRTGAEGSHHLVVDGSIDVLHVLDCLLPLVEELECGDVGKVQDLALLVVVLEVSALDDYGLVLGVLRLQLVRLDCLDVADFGFDSDYVFQ